MRLSAVISIHNEEHRLRECLKRLYFADEIVVLLDRCTDGSQSIAEEFTDRIIQGSLKNANFVICKIYICKVCFDYLYIYNQILVFIGGIGVSGCLEVRVEVLGLFEEFC